MPSNLNSQLVKDKRPWYKKPISLSDLNPSNLLHSSNRFLKRKKTGLNLVTKKNIKDIRSKPMSDGTDGIGVENPDILDIDLIKDEIPVIFDKKKNLYTLGAFVILSLFLVFEIYFFLYSWEDQEIRKKAIALEEEVARLDQEISAVKEKASDAIEFKDSLSSAGPIFSGHIYWSNLLSYLERNTLADVYYSGLTGDTSGTYLLHSWVKDFRAISYQLKTVISDNHTANAKISNEKVNGGDQSLGVLFDLGLTVKPDIFIE